MSTPTIEIEASEELRVALDTAIEMLAAAESHSLMPKYYTADKEALKALFVEVTRARCLAKRYDEQQIHLPLPRT